MASLRATLGFLAGFSALVGGSAVAQDISTFGDGLVDSNRVDLSLANCPDVVVVDVPFCTDECGQLLRQQRASAVAQAFRKADINGDGQGVYAYVSAYASRIAPTGYNQALSERRERYVAGLARNTGATIAVSEAFGETRATGTESANYPSDRFGRIYFTEDPSNMVRNSNGVIQERRGVNVIGFSAPSCRR